MRLYSTGKMEPLLIKEELLDNGVILRLFDASRRLAGDRWLVTLMARAIMPVRETLRSAEGLNPDDLMAIIQALADNIVFEQKRERYFIDEQEKQIVFNQLLKNWQSATYAYISRPDFPVQFVKKSFREYLKKKQLQDQMSRMG